MLRKFQIVRGQSLPAKQSEQRQANHYENKDAHVFDLHASL